LVLRPGHHDTGRVYHVELRNSFGLVKGSDVKIAGVRAGMISGFGLNPALNAIVNIKVTRGDIPDLHADASCEVRQQSLIGEYFLKCEPGTAHTPLPSRTVPLSHTVSTVPVDLVQDVLRLPERQRLRVFIDSLGAGVAGRGDDLNTAVRSAVPALRNTDALLALLDRQNRVLRQLLQDGGTVTKALYDHRRGVTSWVRESGNAAAAAA